VPQLPRRFDPSAERVTWPTAPSGPSLAADPPSPEAEAGYHLAADYISELAAALAVARGAGHHHEREKVLLAGMALARRRRLVPMGETGTVHTQTIDGFWSLIKLGSWEASTKSAANICLTTSPNFSSGITTERTPTSSGPL
jgi:hypothetical protein